jgi:hypothetical protein
MYRSCTDFVRPSATVAPAVVDHFTERPTEGARSYVCFQKAIWGGQIVVSFLMHFHRLDDLLFVEASVWALPPLGAAFMDGLSLSHDVRDDRSALIRQSMAATTGLLLRSTYRATVAPVRERRRRQVLLRLVDEELRRGTPINYGRGESLRSEAADASQLKHFSNTDVTVHVRRVVAEGFQALNTFLDDHGVETERLSRQFNVIMHQTSLTIRESAIAIGDNGTARVTTGGAAAEDAE